MSFSDDSFIVDSDDWEKQIRIDKIVLDIHVTCRHDGTGVEGARVTFNGTTMITDVQGNCVYKGDFASGTVHVEHDEYSPQNISFTFDEEHTDLVVGLDADFVTVRLKQPNGEPYMGRYRIINEYPYSLNPEETYINQPECRFTPHGDKFTMNILSDNYDGVTIAVEKNADPTSRTFDITFEDKTQKEVRFIFKDNEDNPIVDTEILFRHDYPSGTDINKVTDSEGAVTFSDYDTYWYIKIGEYYVHTITTGGNLERTIVVG